MGRVEIDSVAPAFRVADFKGDPVDLAQFRGRERVLLVFNRGFA